LEVSIWLGQLLDANKYFIILTDDIGHGDSSKPSDGLHISKYTYDDMVLANYKLLTEHLNVNHLRLVMGTSMGGMQSWVWDILILTLWMRSCP
jgi:homoserine O-acetyltransferase